MDEVIGRDAEVLCAEAWMGLAQCGVVIVGSLVEVEDGEAGEGGEGFAEAAVGPELVCARVVLPDDGEPATQLLLGGDDGDSNLGSGWPIGAG
ncbi:MAG: hypothetical protein U0841_24675 [Chloroflexia bacterium]